MCICVDIGKKYLVEIRYGIQFDGRNLFKIDKLSDYDYVLSMCSDQTNFYEKYAFSLNEVDITEFDDVCLDKQTNRLSYFVQNTICTMPIDSGRLTLFNSKFIEKRGDERIKKLIYSDEELITVLKTKLGVEVG